MKVSFLGRLFPQWPSCLGRKRWRRQRNTTAAQLCKTRESAAAALNPGTEKGKCQRYTKKTEGRGNAGGAEDEEDGVIQSHQCPRSQDTELETTNEINKSWVRYFPSVTIPEKWQRGETKQGWKQRQETRNRSGQTEKDPSYNNSNPLGHSPPSIIPLLWALGHMHDHTHTHTHTCDLD